MRSRYTAELANGLGNLASRSAAMIGKYFDGQLPGATNYNNSDLALQDHLIRIAADADAAMLQLNFSGALAAIRSYVDAVNAYVSDEQPWALAKDEEQRPRLATVLYVVAESLRAIAVLYHPTMPKATQVLWESLGAAEAIGPLADQDVTSIKWGELPPGVSVTKSAPLFPRLPEEPGEGEQE